MALQDVIKAGKDKLPDVTPTPPGWHPQASAHELKARLNWGEPGLTILDVREHDAFNEERIMGAMNFPMDWIHENAQVQVPKDRDIYLYGHTDEQTAHAAELLRQAGYRKVAELKGGLHTWQEIGGSTEGSATTGKEPSAGAYNLASRLKEFAQFKAKERQIS